MRRKVMRRGRTGLCLGLCAATIGLAFGSEYAVMNRDVRVPAPEQGPLPRLQENQRLACLYAEDEAYGVVCRDAEGQARLARLPRRDEWGRATARLDSLDGAPSNMVTVLVPVPLLPGLALFRAGQRYEIADSDETTLALRYRFADYEGRFRVPRADARIEPAPEPVTDPDKLRELRLQSALDHALKQREELETSVARARENAERVQRLLRDLRLTEVENRRLAAEQRETEHQVRQALRETANDDAALAQLRKDLDQRIRERTGAEARRETVRRETETLAALARHIAATERDLRRAEQAVAARQAERNARQAVATDPAARQEQDDLVRQTRRALAQQEAVAKDVTETETLKNRLAPWAEYLEALARENETLRERLRVLREELAALRETVARIEP